MDLMFLDGGVGGEMDWIALRIEVELWLNLKERGPSLIVQMNSSKISNWNQNCQILT